MSKRKLILTLAVVLLLAAAIGVKFAGFNQQKPEIQSVYAQTSNTFYMCASGCDFANLQQAFAGMQGSDTLIIRDGTYTGSSNYIGWGQVPPAGGPGSYTTIKSENSGNVTFVGERAFWLETSNPMPAWSYWQFEGIKWVGKIVLNGANHIKFFHCAVEGDMPDGNAIAFAVGTASQHILLEDCIAYGKSRYKFMVYQASEIILRRCVARMDYANRPLVDGGSGPIGVFSIYSSSNVECQNCISIDGDQPQFWSDRPTIFGGAFYGPGSGNNVKWRGSIALNTAMGGGSADKAFQYEDVVLWDVVSGLPRFPIGSGTTFNHITLGDMVTPGEAGLSGNQAGRINGGIGNGLGNDGSGDIGNSIIMGAYNTAIRGRSLGGNALWNNANNGSIIGTDITNINPLTNSLKYLPRIESGSDLSGRATDGGDIGANILKKIGVSGTLYGEPGYDQITDEDLWPWPNEDWVKENMGNYNRGGVDPNLPDGNRGFTAYVSPFGSPNTLTSYIWEYLGNQIPPEIYGAPAPLNITTTSLPNGTVGTLYSQTLQASGGTSPYLWSITSGSLPAGLSLNASTGVLSGTPTTQGTSNFTVQVQDSLIDTDTQSLSITINPESNNPPTAQANATPTSGTTPLTVNFTGSGTDTDGTIASYFWNFGDSQTSIQQNPTHIYNNAGAYTATLTVTDDDGATDTDTVSITVTTVGGGNIYYVATTGNNTNPGTESQPWQTISYAASRVQAGDTVLINPGTYNITSQVNIGTSGQAGSPITFRGNGQGVFLDMSNCTNRNCFEIGWANYITVENLEIRASQIASGDVRGIRVTNSEHVTLRNNIVHDAGHANIFVSLSDYILIENNESYGATGIGSPTGGVGVYIADGTDYATVRDNRLHDNFTIGLHMNADTSGTIVGALIENNTIYNNGSTGINCDSITNSTYRNNLIYNNGIRGIALFSQDGSVPANNNEVYHNTIIMPAGAYYIIGVNNDSTQNKIYNNILLSEGSVPAIDSNTGSYTGLESDYNLMSSSNLSIQQSRGFDQNSIASTITAVFTNPAGNDYSLPELSPAVDNGTITLTYSQDIIGTSRPQGTNPDIGSYEYPQTPTVPELTLTKSALVNNQPVSEAASGDTITYTITYQNTGQGDATKVIITDPIPAGTTYVQNSAAFISGPTGVIDQSTPTIKWTILSVPAGTGGSVGFEVRVE